MIDAMLKDSLQIAGGNSLGLNFSLTPTLMPTQIIRRRVLERPLKASDELPVDSLFSELPAELKSEILRYLDDEDVYTISLLSRQLHYLALPVFVSRQNGQLMHRSLYMYKPPFKLLRAARVALYVTGASGIFTILSTSSQLVMDDFDLSLIKSWLASA